MRILIGIIIALALAVVGVLGLAAYRVLRGKDRRGTNEKVRTTETVIAVKRRNGNKEVIG